GKEVTELVIPNSVTSIGEYAFYGCSGLTSVTIPNSVTSIGRAAFDSCEGLKSVAIPNSVTSIGRAAFENCFGLTSVTIPNSVTSIGEYAFCWCYGLTSVTIPNSVTSIGGYAFWWCYGLTSVTIPEGVTSIGDYAFFECSGLTSVTIPESVKSIGEYAFNSCSSLTRVVCYAENPPATGYLVFFRVPLNTAELYVPQSALDKYKNASPWSQFKNIYPISDGGGDDGDINGDLKSAKELVADRTYPYASEDAKNAAQEAMAAVATSPEDAAQKAEALLKAYRQYAESHSMLEGCPGATDMTNYIKNPKAEETINSAVWKTVLGEGSGGSIGFRDDQPWTDDSGNATHRYFDGGNWGASAWDVTFKQDIALPAGRYLLTAMGRSEVDVAMTLFAGDVTAEMAHIGPSGGLFDNGWERTSVEFELQKAATVSIGVRGVASAIHQWMSFSDFRLVQFPNTVVVDGIVYDVKSENLFVNGSFDNGVDGWKTVGYETDAVLYNFVYPEQGGYDGGAYITTYAAGKDSETSIRQSVSVVPGKTYYFSVYTSGKSPNAENYQYNALFKMTDAHTENGVIKEFEWPQGAKTVSTDWSQTKCVFTAESYFVGVRMSWNEGAKFDGFVLYEVAGDASIELALANLDKALAAARAEAGKYNVGNGLFQYPEAEMAPLTRAIAAAQAAYDAAESKEAAEDAIEALNAAVAAFAPAMTLPVADQAYLLSLTTSEGTFRLNMEEGIRIAEEGTPVFLVAQGDGTYALATVKGEYVNYAGG
ncbi:MAG: leucine-rich repeat protein, partial [Prevotellaceae bacterium]|nr:leucine-rich repeat protein [Prevotellaceae bacterium]